MTDIIFQYTPGESNWLNKEWAQAKKHERIIGDIMYLERECSHLTQGQKAKKLGMRRTQYVYWKNKFKL